MVSGSQSLSLQLLEEKKLMSFADNLDFQIQCIMVLWEIWGGFIINSNYLIMLSTAFTAFYISTIAILNFIMLVHM